MILITSNDHTRALASRTDPRGKTLTFDHQVTSAGTPAESVSYSYDPNGNLAGYSATNSTASYGYDNRDRMQSAQIDFGPFQKGYGYSYYRNGLKKTYTDPEGKTYNYHYDQANRLGRIDIPDEGSLTVNAYRWNEPARVTLPGGIVQSTDHDSLMRSKARSSATPAAAVLLDYQYRYSDVGNIEVIDTEHGQYAYGYDDADRLTTADNPNLPDEAYSYDAVGNRLTDNETGQDQWEYDERDRLLDAVTDQYLYDDAGSRTGKLQGDALVQGYGYDTKGRLTEVTDADGNVIASYRYDPMGRRISKSLGESTTYFLYAEEGLIGEYDQAGNRIAAYGYTPGASYGTEPLWQYRGGSYGYYHRNHLGTPVLITDRTNAVLWRAEYESFGEAIISGVVENPLRLPGQYFDAETGLHYNYFRDYDPSVGRYIESDPIGLEGGINTYLYANANPVRFIDPRGQRSATGLFPGPGDFPDTPDYSSCSYYDRVANENGCNYHHNAANICRGSYHPWSVAANGMLRACAMFSSYTVNQVMNCVRACLAAYDEWVRENDPSCRLECTGCTKRECIDQYHWQCFNNCGVSGRCYGGNYDDFMPGDWFYDD